MPFDNIFKEIMILGASVMVAFHTNFGEKDEQSQRSSTGQKGQKNFWGTKFFQGKMFYCYFCQILGGAIASIATPVRGVFSTGAAGASTRNFEK